MKKSSSIRKCKYFIFLTLLFFTVIFHTRYTHAAAVAQPKLVSVKEKGSTKVVLTWKKVSGAAGYRVYKHEEGTKWAALVTIRSGSTVKYTDPKVVPGKKYYYTVRAYKKDGSKVSWGSYDNTGLNLIAGLSSIKMSKTKISIDRTKTYTLKLTGTSEKPVWKSADTSIAKVSSSGKVTAKAVGKTKISATLSGKKFTCTVTVLPLFKASSESLSIEINKTGIITFTSEYSGEIFNASKKDPSVVTCKWNGWNGNDNSLLITGTKIGTTQVVVTSKASGKSIILNITVTEVNMTAHFDEIAKWVIEHGDQGDGENFKLVITDKKKRCSANLLYVRSKKQLIFTYISATGAESSETTMVMNRKELGKGIFKVSHAFRTTKDGTYGKLEADLNARTYRPGVLIPFVVLDNHADITDNYLVDYSCSELDAAMKAWKTLLSQGTYDFKELGFSLYE